MFTIQIEDGQKPSLIKKLNICSNPLSESEEYYFW